MFSISSVRTAAKSAYFVGVFFAGVAHSSAQVAVVKVRHFGQPAEQAKAIVALHRRQYAAMDDDSRAGCHLVNYANRGLFTQAAPAAQQPFASFLAASEVDGAELAPCTCPANAEYKCASLNCALAY